MRRHRCRRPGNASVETLLLAGLFAAVALVFLPLGLSVCRAYWEIVASLVGWPYF